MTENKHLALTGFNSRKQLHYSKGALLMKKLKDENVTVPLEMNIEQSIYKGKLKFLLNKTKVPALIIPPSLLSLPSSPPPGSHSHHYAGVQKLLRWVCPSPSASHAAHAEGEEEGKWIEYSAPLLTPSPHIHSHPLILKITICFCVCTGVCLLTTLKLI